MTITTSNFSMRSVQLKFSLRVIKSYFLPGVYIVAGSTVIICHELIGHKSFVYIFMAVNAFTAADISKRPFKGFLVAGITSCSLMSTFERKFSQIMFLNRKCTGCKSIIRMTLITIRRNAILSKFALVIIGVTI